MKRFVYVLNPHLQVLAGWKGALGILLLCTMVASPNAQQQQSAAHLKASGTNEARAIPQSVFVMPKAKPEGVDPFFPRSRYPYIGNQRPVVAPTAPPAPVALDLKLKAISGLPEHRLALINNHVFEAGEEGEVITNTGRMRIRCLEVHEDSAVVQVGAEQRELRLKDF